MSSARSQRSYCPSQCMSQRTYSPSPPPSQRFFSSPATPTVAEQNAHIAQFPAPSISAKCNEPLVSAKSLRNESIANPWPDFFADREGTLQSQETATGSVLSQEWRSAVEQCVQERLAETQEQLANLQQQFRDLAQAKLTDLQKQITDLAARTPKKVAIEESAILQGKTADDPPAKPRLQLPTLLPSPRRLSQGKSPRGHEDAFNLKGIEARIERALDAKLPIVMDASLQNFEMRLATVEKSFANWRQAVVPTSTVKGMSSGDLSMLTGMHIVQADNDRSESLPPSVSEALGPTRQNSTPSKSRQAIPQAPNKDLNPKSLRKLGQMTPWQRLRSSAFSWTSAKSPARRQG